MKLIRVTLFLFLSVFLPTHVFAAPYAAISIDAVLVKCFTVKTAMLDYTQQD